MLRPLRFGATVRAARVTSAAERAWYGAFPLELKLPLFDSVAGKPGGASGSSSVYPHGILWEGTISSKKTGYLSLIGEFSLPRFIHDDTQMDFTVEWLNGDFEFELEVLWNTSDVSALNVQNSYSSPVYLGATKKYLSLQKETPNELFDVDGEFVSTPSLDIDPVVKRAPVILLGTYSADGTSFLWSGNLSAVIPDVVQVTPWSKSSYWSTANGDVPLEHLPWIPRKPEVEALPATTRQSSALGVSVTGGNVTVISNGTLVNWWDGKLPVAIPMPPFNRVIKGTSKRTGKTDKGTPKPSYASGVVWDATLQRQGNVTLRLQGNFSLPIFIHGPGELFAIDWKIGKISLDFKLLWNATLDGVFQEGHNYSSPIFFRATKSSDTATDIIEDMQSSVEGSAELQFVAAGVAEASGLSQAPIILHGSFSPERTEFLWSGNATVILPTPSGPVRLQMTSVVPPSSIEVSGKVAVGAEVIGGSVDAGVANSSFSTVWNGELPVPIRRPDLLGRGISWKGELIGTSLTEAQLDGSFSTLLSEDAGFTFPVTVYQGKFSLQLSLLWSVSVDGLLPPGTTVYSPIYLRGTAASDDAEAWFAVDQDPSRQKTERTLQKDTPGSLRVPIILQGAYSSDLTTFWWSGRIILAFPPVSSDKLEQLRITKPRFPVPNNPPPGNFFMKMTMDENLSSTSGSPAFRPLRLGARVSSARISNSTGSIWSGQLPLQLPVPLFDTFIEPGQAATRVSGPPLAYGHGISWEGMLSASSPGFLSFTGEFSMLGYIHGGGLENFATHTSHGHFNFGLRVLWNTSDISNLNIKGTYFSPVFLGARQKYSHLQDVPIGSLSDITNTMKLIPSNEVDVALKKAPVILLGMFSSNGKSFIWSGDVSVVIPDVVPVPTWEESNYWSEYNGVNPPGHVSSIPRRAEVDILSAVPASSRALGISVTDGNVSIIANGSYISWWNGNLPLPIPIPAFSKVIKNTSKPVKSGESKSKLSYVKGLVWDATLRRLDNVTLRLQGNFSVPIFIHGPAALFAIDRKVGNFTLDFKLRWNTTLEGLFQEGRNYSSHVFFRASKPTDSISNIIPELQSPSSVKSSTYFQFESLTTANASALLRAPIILHGTYSPDKTKFLWSGNATLIFPKPSGSVLEMAVKERSGSGPPETANSGTVAIGAEVLDGDAVAGTSGSTPSKLWNGEIPVPIRRPDLIARGVTWKGEITKVSPTDVELNGTFSSLWTGAESPTFPFSVYEGKFSVKLGLLWNVSVDGLLPAGATVYSPIYLRGITVPKESEAWLAEEDNFQRMAVELAQPQEIVPALRVPIILQGTNSPDLSTFWWTGRIILVFPKPSIVPIDLHEIPVTKSSAVGATVTSGSVLAAGDAELWDGSLPVVLPPGLETVVWNGALTPSVGGTVELRGLFYGPVGPGEFAFVLSPLWSTPLAGHVVPGRNYTSPLFLREPTDPAPWQGTSAVSADMVPIILQGSFSSDKSSFSWSGNVIIAFP